MMRRSFTALALLALGAAPLAAQMAGMKDHDPDKKAGGGKLPAGWTGRTDKATAKLEDAAFAPMGKGFHVTSGPAAIYWREADRSTAVPFKASATFTQLKAPMHPEAYGLFFSGNKLDAPDQTYFYVLVRGDGKVTLKHRAGAEVHTLMDWTENAAVHKADANGKATNIVSVDARSDSTRLMVNGAQVAALNASAVTGGVVGLRVNHNLDVQVDEFTVSKGATVGLAPRKAPKKASKAKG